MCFRLFTWNMHIEIFYFIFYFIPRKRSRVWNRSGLSVCVSVSQRSHGWTVCPRVTKLGMEKFGIEIDLDIISAKFKAQDHRSNVKVTRSQSQILNVSNGLTCADSLCHVTWHHVTSRHDVTTSCYVTASCDITAWRHNIMWYLWIALISCRKVFQARILTKRAWRGRARQRSGIFIVYKIMSHVLHVGHTFVFSHTSLRLHAYTTLWITIHQVVQSWMK